MAMKRIYTTLIVAISALSAVADTRDSIPDDIRMPGDIPSVKDSIEVPASFWKFPTTSIFSTLPASYDFHHETQLPVFRPQAIHPGIIASWDGGALGGSVSQIHLPGLMGIEQGSIEIGQQLGNFSFTAYAEALKYGSFASLYRQTGVGISLSYDISKRVGVTLYGSLYSNPGLMSPAMRGFAAATAIGGYVDWRISDRFGIKAGGRVERDMATNRWHAQPTLIPYIRLNKRDVIGVDVGGILYNLLYWNRHNKFGGAGNPTIGPPVMKHSEMYGY